MGDEEPDDNRSWTKNQGLTDPRRILGGSNPVNPLWGGNNSPPRLALDKLWKGRTLRTLLLSRQIYTRLRPEPKLWPSKTSLPREGVQMSPVEGLIYLRDKGLL